MHRAASEGLMPVQMSYSGFNFDIVTGASAALVALALWTGRGGRRLAFAWNALGSTLLLVIVSIAVASMPMLQAFGPERENRWIAYFPYVWLPTILVPAALLGHVLVWRKLLAGHASDRSVPLQVAQGQHVVAAGSGTSTLRN
jgi:hypothetical protein